MNHNLPVTLYSGLPLETFAEVHDELSQPPDSTVADAARRLGTFGKRHGLSLSGRTIRELLDESRPSRVLSWTRQLF
jgi:hypothetical protein